MSVWGAAMQEALWINEWMVDGLCSALKMTTVPILLAPAVSSLRSSRFQFFQCVKAHFWLWDFAVSILFVQDVLTLDPNMTGAFSLPRTQPKYCSPSRPSLGTSLKALLPSPISLSKLPCFINFKALAVAWNCLIYWCVACSFPVSSWRSGTFLSSSLFYLQDLACCKFSFNNCWVKESQNMSHS